MKKLFLFVLFCLFYNTVAFCAGCTLTFQDNSTLKNIDNAAWHLDDGDIYIQTIDGYYQKIDGHYADKKSLAELTKINGENVNIDIPDSETAFRVEFKCNKWNNGEYFAYYCKYGYDNGDIIDEDRKLRDRCFEKEWTDDDEYDYDEYDYDDEEVENAKKVLTEFFAYAKNNKNKSGWKTADGKFNSMRLASDLTAGVVLGTVGGVVSGVVIKKKQLEKGFDVLHCSVGGQTVADWGDEFKIGIQQ